MSTQPIARRALRPVRSPPELRRALSIGAMFALVFAAAFLVGHTRSATAVGERLPPSLPAVATPTPAALQVAPPIELGVTQPPVRQPTRVLSTPAPQAPAPPPASSVPSVQAPEPVATTPVAPPVTAPPVVSTPVAPAPPPEKATSPKSGTSHGSGGSGSGQTFESSE